MRGLITVVAALIMAATAYFFISAEEPEPPAPGGTGAGETAQPEKGIDPLTGTPATGVPKPAASESTSAPITARGTDSATRPGWIPPGTGREEASQILFDSTLNPDLSVAERIRQLQKYIAHSTKYLEKGEVGRRVVDLLGHDPDTENDGAFRGAVLGSLKGLNAEPLVPFLFDGIKDHRTKVRLGALTALVDYQQDSAVRQSVRRMLRDEQDPGVRAKAKALLAMDVRTGEQKDPGKHDK